MGFFDVPAGIDAVRSLTGRDKVTCVGHSEGGTSIFVALTTRPEYNAKIKYAVSMASFTYMTNIGFPLNIILAVVYLFNNVRDFEFAQDSFIQKLIALTICTLYDGVICNLALNFILGPSMNDRNVSC